MPATKPNLVDIKRRLISARIEAMEAAATARRMGNVALANRLRSIAGYLANELDYVEGLLLSRQP